MEIFKFRIDGRLPGMNDIIIQAKRNPYNYARFKKESTQLCEQFILMAFQNNLKKPFNVPIDISISWFEPNRRRDLDNIQGGGVKFILDSLVNQGIISNDTQKYVSSISHKVFIDPKDPHIEVTLSALEPASCPPQDKPDPTTDTKAKSTFAEA